MSGDEHWIKTDNLSNSRRVPFKQLDGIECLLVSYNQLQPCVNHEIDKAWRDVGMPFVDKSLHCLDCGREFVFTADDQESYAKKGWTNEPTRCKHCQEAHEEHASA